MPASDREREHAVVVDITAGQVELNQRPRVESARERAGYGDGTFASDRAVLWRVGVRVRVRMRACVTWSDWGTR